MSMLLGDNGILKKAQESSEKYNDSIAQEKILMGDLSDFELIQVSNAIKGRDTSDLPTKEEYVGDFIKIGSKDY